MSNMVCKSVEVILGDDAIVYDVQVPDDWSEDEIYEHVCDSVFSNISINVVDSCYAYDCNNFQLI